MRDLEHRAHPALTELADDIVAIVDALPDREVAVALRHDADALNTAHDQVQQQLLTMFGLR